MARTAKWTGIRERQRADGSKYFEVYVDVNNKRIWKEGGYPSDTPPSEMLKWRADTREAYAGKVPASGTFAADVANYIAQNATMPTIKQRTVHLNLWLDVLGRDRARRTNTSAEINLVMQDWKTGGHYGRGTNHGGGLTNGTLCKRRTALKSLFVFFDGAQAVNPVRGVPRPVEPKPEARALDYGTIHHLIASMPTHRHTTDGRQLSLARIRCAVIAYTGIPPAQLKQITETDLCLIPGRATARVMGRKKGRGTATRTVPLTEDGRLAFVAFHDANAYGGFSVDAVNHCFKAAAKRIGVDPSRVR